MKWFECTATNKYSGAPIKLWMMQESIYGAYLKFRDLNVGITDIKVVEISGGPAHDGSFLSE